MLYMDRNTGGYENIKKNHYTNWRMTKKNHKKMLTGLFEPQRQRRPTAARYIGTT